MKYKIRLEWVSNGIEQFNSRRYENQREIINGDKKINIWFMEDVLTKYPLSVLKAWMREKNIDKKNIYILFPVFYHWLTNEIDYFNNGYYQWMLKDDILEFESYYMRMGNKEKHLKDNNKIT
jgi:hypothetical protein